MKEKGYKINNITGGGGDRSPSQKDFTSMQEELKKGRNILYHMAGNDKDSPGHYLVLKGYNKDKNEYIFHDPAGNKKEGYWQGRDKGQDVRYKQKDLEKWGIRGSVRSVY